MGLRTTGIWETGRSLGEARFIARRKARLCLDVETFLRRAIFYIEAQPLFREHVETPWFSMISDLLNCYGQRIASLKFGPLPPVKFEPKLPSSSIKCEAVVRLRLGGRIAVLSARVFYRNR